MEQLAELVRAAGVGNNGFSEIDNERLASGLGLGLGVRLTLGFTRDGRAQFHRLVSWMYSSWRPLGLLGSFTDVPSSHVIH